MAQDFYTVTEDFIEVFRFRRSTDAAVREWAQALDRTIAGTPSDTPFYILLDVSGDDVTFTPLARAESKRVFGAHRGRHGYIAMLFEWRTSPYFARLFFSTMGKLAFKLNYFHDRERAYAWLHQMHELNR